MQTQTAMTSEEIQAKISELKSKKVELEVELAKMSKDAALAMVAGEDMNKFEETRHKIAEDARHVGELIKGLELSLVDAAKNVDVEKFEKKVAQRAELRPIVQTIRQRVAVAKQALKDAEAEEKRIDQEWFGNARVVEAFRDVLKKKHGMSDVEISLIEAKYKL